MGQPIIEMRRVDTLRPYENNARVHSEKQIEQLRASLREFGFVAPALITPDGSVIAGHGRLMAAQAEGMEDIPCVIIDHLTDEQRRAYILADNRLAEAASWDMELVNAELAALGGIGYDVKLTGFDADIRIEEPEGTEEDDGDEEYQAFVDKFKPKKTTDDCYTPKNIYETVLGWARKHYKLGDAEIVRPFFPGGDYAGYEYPDECVVVDNPPFSIISEIVRTYMSRGIRFFLFAPGLTLFSIASGEANYVLASNNIVYENGADILTGFVTNLGDYKIETAPELYKLIRDANRENEKALHAERPKYLYPTAVMSSKDYIFSKYGITMKLKAEDVMFIRAMDEQKESDSAIYGGGFLLSEKAAAEKAAAEKAAAEKWKLSDRERELQKGLGR